MDLIRLRFNSTHESIDAAPSNLVPLWQKRRWEDSRRVYLDWYRQHRMSSHARRDASIAAMAETFLRELEEWRDIMREQGVTLTEWRRVDIDFTAEGGRPWNGEASQTAIDEAMWSGGGYAPTASGVGCGCVPTPGCTPTRRAWSASGVRPSASFYGESWDQQGHQQPGRALVPGVTVPHPWARYEAIPWTPGQATTRLPSRGEALMWNPSYLEPHQRRHNVVGQSRLHDPLLWNPQEVAERMDLVNTEHANLNRDVRAMGQAWGAQNQRWKAAWNRQFNRWNTWYRENRRTAWSPVSGFLGLGEDPVVVTPATANRYLEQLLGYRSGFRERAGRLTTPDPPRPPEPRDPGDWFSEFGETAKAIAILIAVALIAWVTLK
jgi:hypothetical protein